MATVEKKFGRYMLTIVGKGVTVPCRSMKEAKFIAEQGWGLSISKAKLDG